MASLRIVLLIWQPSSMLHFSTCNCNTTLKSKVLPYSLPSVGPGADPSVSADDFLSHPRR